MRLYWCFLKGERMFKQMLFIGFRYGIMQMHLIAFADVLFYKYLADSTIDHFI